MRTRALKEAYWEGALSLLLTAVGGSWRNAIYPEDLDLVKVSPSLASGEPFEEAVRFPRAVARRDKL
jgi:hypothetical protein